MLIEVGDRNKSTRSDRIWMCNSRWIKREAKACDNDIARLGQGAIGNMMTKLCSTEPSNGVTFILVCRVS